MTPDEADALLATLNHSPLFRDLPDGVLHEILRQMRRERWTRRSQVMPATDTVQHFYVLLDGRVRIEAGHPGSGRAVTLYLLCPGDGHNLITLFVGRPHHVLAETLDEVKAISAPIRRWRAWLDDYPALRQALVRAAAERLRELTELAEDLALHETSARLAHLLLRHLDREDPSGGLLHGLAHEDIARLIGSVRVVVNRLLNRFKHEGIIDANGRHIRITDLEALLRKAERRLRRHD